MPAAGISGSGEEDYRFACLRPRRAEQTVTGAASIVLMLPVPFIVAVPVAACFPGGWSTAYGRAARRHAGGRCSQAFRRRDGSRADSRASCDDQAVAKSPNPEEQRSVDAPAAAEPAPRKTIIVVAGLTIAAVALVLVGARDIYRSAVLATRGTVVSAPVLFVRYGSRADEVKVHLPEPTDRDVELVAWTGHPHVGQTISVRYDSANPHWPALDRGPQRTRGSRLGRRRPRYGRQHAGRRRV